MSKREAEYYLTDRNYDAYDDEEEDVGGTTFKRASEDVLRRRKIKPLKRRSRASLKQHSNNPSLSSFSFKSTTSPIVPTTTSSTNTNSTTSTNNEMKEKIKKFTEQICGLNESFISFVSKSIKEDIVFDISLNIGQYQEKRKEIEKEYDEVIKYLTNNKNALISETKSNFAPESSITSSKQTFSFTKPTEESKETKPLTFGFGNNSSSTSTTTTKPAFTFNLNKDNTDKPASTTTTFSFNKTDNKSSTTTTPTFSFNKTDNKSSTTTTPTFSFNKSDNKPAFSFNLKKDDSKESTNTTAASTFTFKKPDDKDNSSKPTIPTFKPFTFNFGQKMANASSDDQGKTLPKPNFSFGVTPPSKDEIAAAQSNDDDDEATEQIQLTTGAGEEDEDTVYEVKAKIHLYSMEEKKYISRGVGLLKVNKNKKTNKARLLGRMDNGSVFLNVSLFKEMVVNEPVNANQFTFNAMDRLEGSDEIKMIRFAVRVKDKESAKKLYNAIIENKN
ncbi:hypothetical protein BCR32DRAFT_244283 [Anaeromyces robustus]|uniref:RanBD1 domain-containing protein n=1 Tax=Anaeromyces robustus TaxID=1754192 RepID=A0A1Y1X943_9FUNG|nr:hypothetical protein BCR32DRAFT_244283 [Anaeromyces robustus]|eukprot:ORX82249.1 hypothetical protein BCR32DRAFT_244283 [Anaeromyces robustus]